MLSYQSDADSLGNRLVACSACGYSRTTHWPIEQIHHHCQLPPAEPVGDALKSLIDQLGLRRKNGCRCRQMIAKMNRWGVAGCRERRAEIIEHLAAAYHGLSWAEIMKAAGSA